MNFAQFDAQNAFLSLEQIYAYLLDIVKDPDLSLSDKDIDIIMSVADGSLNVYSNTDLLNMKREYKAISDFLDQYDFNKGHVEE